MSLQVWLPLNGDLTQQGLSGIEVTNSGATVNNEGKIGKCYQFGTAASYMTIPAESMKTCTEATVSFWVKILSWNTSYATLFQAGTNGYSWQNYIFGVLRNSTNSTLCFTIGNGSTTSTTTCQTSALELNTWYHLTFTYNSNGDYSIYINGVLNKKSHTDSIIPAFSQITMITLGRANGNGYQSNCLMNDVRIYDHCLSIKEVKELSKGLILHYKLDGKEETSSNLITTEDGLTNTAYNSANGKYGYNADSNIAKIVGDFNGKHCTKVYMITEGQAARPYVYISSLFVSNGGSQPEYKAISFDYYGTIGTYINHYKLGNGTGTATWKNTTTGKSGTFTNSGNILVTPNQWNHIEIILHGTTEADAQFGYFPLGDQHTSSANNYWLFANVQVEAKDHVTPYMGPGGSRNYTTEFDCSGYEYNGSPLGTLTNSDDTIKYDSCVSFNGTDNGILIENLPLNSIINNSVTYSFWIKPNGENSARSVYFGSYSGTSWSVEKNTSNLLRLYWNGSPDEVCTGATITDGVWQHICITKNGSNDIKVYINGQQKWASTAAHNTLTFPTTYRIGRDTRSGDGTPYKGLMSDFRIYATALSAEDVAELYHTAASVDNHGNVYAGEIKEV